MPTSRGYDVIVVGLGAMGSATLYHLARRGVRALGIEQLTALHDRGSSHGDSRIIRETYFEHPLYVPLVQRAHELWRDLEAATGKTLLSVNGGLMIGPPDWSVVTGTLKSARQHGLPHEVLSCEQVAERFPPFQPYSDCVAVFDPRAGFLEPEACVSAHLELARAAGADTKFNQSVVSWTASSAAVSVITADGRYESDKLLISAGPWVQSLIPELRLPLQIERQTVFWFEVPSPREHYSAREFPIYAYEFKPGVICYGFPELEKGVKASVMHEGAIVPAPQLVKREVTDSDLTPLRGALAGVLPDLARARVRGSTTCIFTNTPDRNFLIDFHPEHDNVLISSPCSGHGFKFASAIGEVQAELLTGGKARFDISPFRLDRFMSEN